MTKFFHLQHIKTWQ